VPGRPAFEARVARAAQEAVGDVTSTPHGRTELPCGIAGHRVSSSGPHSVCDGRVVYAPAKSLWFLGMAIAAIVGGSATFSVDALALFVVTTGVVLLFGHSLGSHRKLIHDSFGCPRWLEYALVYCGVQVGLAGPLGLLRQHELRDFAQRLPDCHPYLRHGRSFWRDAWWQLNCDLRLADPPSIRIERSIANDRVLRLLERTWRLQQVPVAVLFYLWGGWAYVFWGVCARVTAGVFGHWLIGYFAHNHGSMRYVVRGAAVQGHNVRFASLVTMGECWHNNHHAFPGSARLGLRPGEWDPGWWVLVALRRVGLVTSVRLPRDLAYRPELVVIAQGIPEPAIPPAHVSWPRHS
jgi:stearoyl-CoA desaturase (delta-9 desaturase)